MKSFKVINQLDYSNFKFYVNWFTYRVLFEKFIEIHSTKNLTLTYYLKIKNHIRLKYNKIFLLYINFINLIKEKKFFFRKNFIYRKIISSLFRLKISTHNFCSNPRNLVLSIIQSTSNYLQFDKKFKKLEFFNNKMFISINVDIFKLCIILESIFKKFPISYIKYPIIVILKCLDDFLYNFLLDNFYNLAIIIKNFTVINNKYLSSVQFFEFFTKEKIHNSQILEDIEIIILKRSFILNTLNRSFYINNYFSLDVNNKLVQKYFSYINVKYIFKKSFDILFKKPKAIFNIEVTNKNFLENKIVNYFLNVKNKIFYLSYEIFCLSRQIDLSEYEYYKKKILKSFYFYIFVKDFRLSTCFYLIIRNLILIEFNNLKIYFFKLNYKLYNTFYMYKFEKTSNTLKNNSFKKKLSIMRNVFILASNFFSWNLKKNLIVILLENRFFSINYKNKFSQMVCVFRRDYLF